MHSHLLTPFDFNLWANLRLFEACAALNSNQLSTSDAGAYGSIHSTLAHILDAEQWYVWLLLGEPEPYARVDADQLTVLEMHPHIEQSSRDLIKLAASADSLAPRKDGGGINAGVVLAQAITHATEHRTNITTIIAKLNLPEVDVSVWAYHESPNS